jgi:hypothetical protein
LEEEWDESESIRERLLDADIYEEREELANLSDATSLMVSSSGWESAAGRESDEDAKSKESFAPRRRRRKRNKKQENDRYEGRVLKRQTRDDFDDLLSLLHLALITLRVPITWIDLCTYVLCPLEHSMNSDRLSLAV